MEKEVDVLVIGAGPGGYVAAIRAAQLGMKVACIDKRKELGGTCLNIGCIPSKALLHASETYWKFLQEGPSIGLDGSCTINFPQMMRHKQEVVAGFNVGIRGLFKKNKIESSTAGAELIGPNRARLSTGDEVAFKYAILATGSEAIALPFLPFDEKRILSSTGALSLETVPKKLLVIGAGVIGVELGSVYSRLGSEVVFVEFFDRICPTLDLSLSKTLQELLTRQGMQFHLSSKVIGAQIDSHITIHAELPSGPTTFQPDAVLVSIGRRPYSRQLGLENVGITLNSKGQLPVDRQFRTQIPHIFAIGDLIDGPMLAHKASEEGVAVAEIIAGKRPLVDYGTIPSVAYTYPEVAAVGLSEEEATAMGLTLRIGLFPFKANSRAHCSGEEEGFVKLIADATSDQILGVHIIGAHASELIGEAVIALQNRMTAEQLAEAPHAHPTLSEAIKEAALASHKRAIHK